MTNADGVKQSVATSRRVESRGSAAPERSPEALAALRQLSKTLRDSGWVPMRPRRGGTNEPWYARRFRRGTTESNADEAAAAGNGEPRHDAGVDAWA